MEHARLTATFHAGGGTLARLAATLTHHHVLDIVYTTSPPDRATAVIRVPRSDAPRALEKLRRLVETLDVTVDPPLPATTAPHLPAVRPRAVGTAARV